VRPPDTIWMEVSNPGGITNLGMLWSPSRLWEESAHHVIDRVAGFPNPGSIAPTVYILFLCGKRDEGKGAVILSTNLLPESFCITVIARNTYALEVRLKALRHSRTCVRVKSKQQFVPGCSGGQYC
jgi:hypothetical protein